jgi:SpoVK/Ycf46/Vps4 family AAA+-type ATPase
VKFQHLDQRDAQELSRISICEAAAQPHHSMGSRNKRKLEIDFNKSDSDDEDYDNAAAPPRSAKPSRRHKPSSTRKPTKRRRDTYGDSDDDVEQDDDISEDEDSFDENSEEEEQEVNPRTGRRVRSVAKNTPKYEENSDDDEEDLSNSDSDNESARRPTKISLKKRPARDPALTKQSLIVKLQLPADRKMDKPGSKGQRPVSRGSRQGSNAPPTRSSRRISHDEGEPLFALSDSMKHEVVVRPGSVEPESGSRRTRGGKGVKSYPSAILEVSQEEGDDSVVVRSSQAKDEDLASQLEEAAGTQQDETIEPTSRTMAEDDATEKDEDEMDDIRMEEPAEEEHVVQESQHDPEDNDDEDEDDPVVRNSRASRRSRRASSPPASQTDTARRSLRARKPAAEPSSDFEPDAEGEHEVEEQMSDDELLKPTRTGGSSNEGSASGRRSGRLRSKAGSQRSRSRRHASEDEAEEELDVDEIADEAAELDEDARRNRRPGRRAQTRNTEISYEPKLRERGKKPDYRIYRPEYLAAVDEEESAAPAPSPQRKGRGGGTNFYRSLFSTVGPFGGAGEPRSVFGGPAGAAAAGGVDSDSSDDEAKGGQAGVGGTVGMTPTSGFPKPFSAPQAHNNDPLTGAGGGPPGLGKVKDRKALADADPLGVDPNVNFDGVGGLDNHINQLKEMVMLPLLYPELFLNFHVTPPRGVLFHGPPGTGKTLLARALASSVSTNGRKVTFYMRKGADALSKWVGEAEKQLRLLFEEARKNQPSIIFFDEIDGLAPVRSSKQEQIHASIVATLLALMDGMDGRGQVIVIGATNRPDSVDPALRRPGRFDREFYFPLPDQDGRRKIIDIHTKGWEPALADPFKNQLAEITRGYGGADLRALCTEAALNAIQGTFPQIYSSEQKLIVDPTAIKVLAKDFMISVNKIVPSSERSAASGAVPLKKDIEPLLRAPLAAIGQRLEEIIPKKRKITALEEALYDDRDDEYGFEKETMQREFESSRIFRPRLLIQGREGMGQQYLGAALLSKFEGLHVQNFDLPTLMKDSARVSHHA